MKKYLILLLTVFNLPQMQGQENPSQLTDLEQLRNMENALEVLAYSVLNDSSQTNRLAACHQLIPMLVKALKIKNSFDYPFEKLRSISIQYPPDKSFRIFTWQLYVDADEYRYYGAIQMNEPELKLFPLSDRSLAVSSAEHEILNADKWFGALYYNLKQFDSPEGRKYLLFGFNGLDFYNNRKLIEVLGFKKGVPEFGAPVFIQTDLKTGEKIVKNRIVKEYSAEASMGLNMDESLKAIIFDHLILMQGQLPGQGLTNVPDGTYEGYKLKKGLWVYVPKMFHGILDEPPRPEPKLDTRKGVDIFGKKKQ